MRTSLSLLALGATTALAAESWSQLAPAGKKIQWVGHSFHWFLPGPVAQLAKEAGIQGHADLGVDRIGASRPCQHWEKGGEKGNAVKTVLQAGKADILTLATRDEAPDPCIPKFVELANSKRKDMKVMVQETWIVQSAQPEKEKCKASGWGCANRDAATFDEIEATRKKFEQPYQGRLRTQFQGLNKQVGSNFTVMVPLYDAVLTLRQMVVKGELPGVAKQSGLFMDDLGHATKPLQHMASYMWFGAMYGINPMGMKTLATGTPAGQAAILQKLAWDTLKKEPLSGVA